MIKTSRALSSENTKAFRIEKKMVYDELHYDLIWQANGEEDEIAILLEKTDIMELRDMISKIISNS